MKKFLKNDGVVIVEATFVFPIMLFTILMMIYMGNVYYQQAKLNAIVDVAAVKGAAYCADPMLDDIEKGGVPKNYSDIQPYRYLFGLSDVEGKMEKSVRDEFKGSGDGFFGSMAPTSITCNAKFNNSVVMYSFTVEATYKIMVPFRFMGTEPPTILELSAKSTAPVNDNGEFINNLNMALDYYESSGLKKKVSAATGKIKEFFGKFGKN